LFEISPDRYQFLGRSTLLCLVLVKLMEIAPDPSLVETSVLDLDLSKFQSCLAEKGIAARFGNGLHWSFPLPEESLSKFSG
jgi:hypothetical protein